MLRTIIKKEILENLYSYKFTVITLLTAVLVLTSIFVMYRDYELRLENYEILRPTAKQPVAIIPPTPLSIFAKGLDENMGRSYEIRFGGQVMVGSKQQSVNSLFRLFTAPDLLYVVKVVMALCAMLFAFNTVTGEKEAGTLKLSLSNKVGRTVFLTGKWIGSFASFIVPFLLAVILCVILVTLSPMVQMDGEKWLKLGLFLFSSLLYLAVFFSLGFFISCLTHRSASSLVISLFLWALLVFVIPNLGNITARQFVEIPSVERLEEKREQIWIKEVFEILNKETRSEPDFKNALSNINSENARLIDDYRGRFNRLVDITKGITRFSPTAAFTFLATDLAGTGLLDERRLKQAVLQYKDLVWDRPIDSGGNIIGDFPAFSFQRCPLPEVLSADGFINLIVLILFNIIAFSAAYVAFLRYDAR
ncbi:MAG TPA: ABC transporter permease subunit [archaeon]|nr:ABC transporter permease subunit [archaeon]